MKEISTGNKAIAKAVKQALPGVVAAYPITPQTEIVETIADYVTSGQMKEPVYPGRERALRDGGLYWRKHHRYPDFYCDERSRTALHA